tara:strand:+ start:2065 stop:3009 length:945 start_codon:yes stop_codon:yes gene_type:complete
MPANIETQADADEKMVDLPSTGDTVDVKLDDTEKKINKDDDVEVVNESKEVVVEEKKETASKEDMEDYGKKVQSRIDKLTKKVREAERREQAATEYAKNVYQENQSLQQKADTLDDGYVAQYETRVNAELETVKKQLKQAVETGDIDAQVAANQSLASLTMQAERVKSTQQKKDRLKKQREEQGEQQPQYQQQYVQPQMPPPAADPKAESWAEKNEWFGKDEPMTLTSFSIHRNLVEEGFDPQSDSYYNEVDKRMRDNFPHKFDKQVSPTQSVASANRGSPVRRKGTVRLTPSQVAIAKKLGVPLSEYAKYVKE